MSFVQTRGGRVTTCSLHRVTLEDSFLALLGGPNA
jgi:hypothetical protein